MYSVYTHVHCTIICSDQCLIISDMWLLYMHIIMYMCEFRSFCFVEEKKSLDGVKRELDSFTKKAKTIDSHVKTALQELQAFQLKKQQRINELDAVVVLKLHQILHYQQGGAPPTNVAQCLVFPASAREHLANRIGELVHEKQHEKKRYRWVGFNWKHNYF